MKITTKNICITALGVALFVTLSMCLRVPVFDNYYLCLGYIVMTVYLYSVGTIYGTLVGILGTILYCILISGLRGMPGWTLGNIIIGIILGLWFKFIKQNQKHRKEWIITNIISCIVIVIATAIGILGIKSITEVFLYSQPFIVRVTSNMNAFIADVFVLVLSIPICKKVHKIIEKQNLLNNS